VAGPDEQANVLVFLNSAAAGYITGQVIWVDGGTVAERVFGDVTDERRRAEHGQPQ
jgi:NAD(P)-dependent dehydrogenase (short-subunit alcohol dehydrogenase family)